MEWISDIRLLIGTQILQREIAFSRGLPIDFVTSLGRSRPLEDDREGVGAGDGIKADGKNSTGAGGKRKYRRHPKVNIAINPTRGIVLDNRRLPIHEIN